MDECCGGGERSNFPFQESEKSRNFLSPSPSVGVPRHRKFAAKFWQTERAQCIPGTLSLLPYFKVARTIFSPSKIVSIESRGDGTGNISASLEVEWRGKGKMRLFGGSSSSSFSQMESYGGLRKCMAEGGEEGKFALTAQGEREGEEGNFMLHFPSSSFS